MAKHVVVSLSGGMDSSTLLLRALKEYDTVTGISFDYGQKHRVELERAQQLINYLADNGHMVNYRQIQLNGLVDYLNENCKESDCYGGCKINYRQIKLDGLSDLLNSALVEGGDEVPEGHYENDNMKDTVVPNRNKIFASIVQAVALSVANKTEETCDIALGIHAGDHAVYPDCRQEFRDADDKAFREGNWEADRVGYFTPYLLGDKFDILIDGKYLCKELGIDFDEVYKRTNTSYKPYPNGNSDYKSASSVERIEAFIKLDRNDPVQYEDETGPVAYEVAKAYVKELLDNHNTAAELGRD